MFRRTGLFLLFGVPVIVLLALVLLWLTGTPAKAAEPRLPAGITCEMVRAKVVEHGRILAYAWARLQGYSKAEIDQAKKCLK